MTDKNISMITGETQDGAPTGTIRWEIDTVSGLQEDIYRNSPKMELLGMPWSIYVMKRDDEGSVYLAAYLCGIKNESNIWNIDVDVVFSLINKDVSKNFVRKSELTFNHKFSDWGFLHYFEWNRLIDEKEGFIRDDKITIECQFTLRNVSGIRKNLRFDFTNADDPLYDITLVVGGKKLYASKQILAAHSPVFRTMFYGDFAEKEKKEIELKDVEYEAFIEMLNLIYPTGKKIADENAKGLLSLGDRFQIKTILDQVELLLIGSTKFSIATKLKLSEDYRLMGLQGSCLGSIKTVTDYTDLNETDEYEQFSDTTKATLFDKIMKITKLKKDD